MIEPASPRTPPPKIIALDFDAGGDVLVTWSLPNLRRAIVRMPYTVWLEGGGLTIGKSLTQQLAATGLQPLPSPDTIAEQ